MASKNRYSQHFCLLTSYSKFCWKLLYDGESKSHHQILTHYSYWYGWNNGKTSKTCTDNPRKRGTYHYKYYYDYWFHKIIIPVWNIFIMLLSFPECLSARGLTSLISGGCGGRWNTKATPGVRAERDLTPLVSCLFIILINGFYHACSCTTYTHTHTHTHTHSYTHTPKHAQRKRTYYLRSECTNDLTYPKVQGGHLADFWIRHHTQKHREGYVVQEQAWSHADNWLGYDFMPLGGGGNVYLFDDVKCDAKLSVVADQDGPSTCISIQICKVFHNVNVPRKLCMSPKCQRELTDEGWFPSFISFILVSE